MLVVYLLLTVKWSISGADVIEGNKQKEYWECNYMVTRNDLVEIHKIIMMYTYITFKFVDILYYQFDHEIPMYVYIN